MSLLCISSVECLRIGEDASIIKAVPYPFHTSEYVFDSPTKLISYICQCKDSRGIAARDQESGDSVAEHQIQEATVWYQGPNHKGEYRNGKVELSGHYELWRKCIIFLAFPPLSLRTRFHKFLQRSLRRLICASTYAIQNQVDWGRYSGQMHVHRLRCQCDDCGGV